MVRAHRQAWAWQDEWFGLTMEDIRGLEAETQQELAQKMDFGDEPLHNSSSSQVWYYNIILSFIL